MQVDSAWANVKYVTDRGRITDRSTAATSATIAGTVTQASEAVMLFNKPTMLFANGRIELGSAAQFAGQDGSVDGRFYQTSRSSLQLLWSQYTNGAGDFSNRTALYIDSTGKLGVQKGGSTAVGTTTISLNAWHHFEFTRSGNTLYAFVDGNLECTLAISGNLGANTPAFGHAGGGLAASDAYFVGHMSQLRVEIGTARHTASYTAPSDDVPIGTLSVAGTVYDSTNTPCARTVRLLRRDTMQLLCSTTSDASTGAYSLVTDYSGECSRIVLDSATNDPLYNDIIDRVIAA